MFLLILDKNPYKAAELIPDRLKFKQLLELTQLLASCGITNQVKPVKQGKKICEWIKRNENIYFVYIFYSELLTWCESHIKMLPNTFIKFLCTRDFLWKEADKCRTPNEPIKIAIFRYVKEYAEMTEYESNSELPIDECVECYKKYVEWKEEQFNKKRAKKKEEKWQKIIEKGCEHEWHPQQDVCFCKLNAGYICWWKNCPMIND